MSRIYNFSAGPAALPEAVLERARDELLDWHGCGMSIAEVSHRGPQFAEVAQRSEQTLRELFEIPDRYRVLFLQGGATLQFSMVPMNLAPGGVADYVCTGHWGRKTIAEAKHVCRVNVAADSKDNGDTAIPQPESWQRSEDAAYLHYTPNETIGGVEFHDIPASNGVPLVADMSSNILSRPIDVSKFGVIYAGAQKNIGPSGLTLVIVEESLLGRASDATPAMLNYAAYAQKGSMQNTPATFPWYVAGLVFEWIRDEGGVAEMGRRNDRKAAKLYAAVDDSDFYSNPVAPECRSRMNVPFALAEPSLDEKFLKGANTAGLVNLKWHRSVGGMRASIYNGMPEAGVDTLIEYMNEFERRFG